MADDLEAFLRQAAEQRLARKRAAQQRREASGQVPPQSPRPQRPAPPPEPPVVDAVLADESIGQESVSEHVKRHLDSSEIEQEAAELGSGVQEEERQFEEQIHQAFDREISDLDERRMGYEGKTGYEDEADAKREASARANFIVELFRNRQRLREAIVLGEILSRPPGLD